MSEEIKNIGLYKDGDVFSYTVQIVKNDCSNLIEDVELQITIPAGLDLAGYTIPKGIMDSINDKWEAGNLTPGQLAEASFDFIVEDNCQGPWDIVFDVTASSSCENCFATPQLTLKVEGISCCELASCYASHADDSAAAASGIALGQIYYNTTISALVARLT